MLAPAHVGHLAMLRTLIRQSAAEGSFESSLAVDTPQSVDFFDKLKRALSHGYFVEEDAKTGRMDSVAVPGYVFWPDDRHSGNPPAGFGLFRALEGGYELWLAGLELGRRGDGHGRALIDALFATTHGKKTWVVRIPRGSRYRAQCSTCCFRTDSRRSGIRRICAGSCATERRQVLKTRIRDMVGGRPGARQLGRHAAGSTRRPRKCRSSSCRSTRSSSGPRPATQARTGWSRPPPGRCRSGRRPGTAARSAGTRRTTFSSPPKVRARAGRRAPARTRPP